MLESVEFQNYRVLRAATLPLSSCSLIVGPNGSGKSTAIKAIQDAASIVTTSKQGFPNNEWLSLDTEVSANARIKLNFAGAEPEGSVNILRKAPGQFDVAFVSRQRRSAVPEGISGWLRGVRVFSLDPGKIAQSSPLAANAAILPDGSHLAVVLTQLQDRFPERFDALNRELAFWLPEFDRVLFDITPNGERALMLRTKVGGHAMKAGDVSDGTLLILCIMALSFLPEPPNLICLEEPDRGIHPRLLRQVYDAMVRLSDPASCGDKRKPVQVIATTHSPYFLDLFRDHPEDVVLAEKGDDGATFHRLKDMPHYEDIMHDAQLGDAWYSGILGGVPTTP